MSYKNIPLANLRKLADRSTPALSLAANPVVKADLQQIVDGLRSMKICRFSDDAETKRTGPYQNVKVSDLDFGTYTYFQMTDGNTVATKTQVDALINGLKAMGLFKATGALNHKHGPYSNVYLKNLKRWYYDGVWRTPVIPKTITAPNPSTNDYDDILWALYKLNIAGLAYPVVITKGGTGAGSVSPAAGTHYLNHDGTLTITFTPDADNEISAFTITPDGGSPVDHFADINDPTVPYTFTIAGSTFLDGTLAVNTVTVDVHFSASV